MQCPSIWCAKFENIIKDWKMQIRQISVLNNKIKDIIFANVSKLYEYCNFTLSTAVTYKKLLLAV